MININKFHSHVQVSFKHEFLFSNHHITKFLIGHYNGKTYLVLARTNGLIQLYEKCKYDENDGDSDLYDDDCDLYDDAYGSYYAVDDENDDYSAYNDEKYHYHPDSHYHHHPHENPYHHPHDDRHENHHLNHHGAHYQNPRNHYQNHHENLHANEEQIRSRSKDHSKSRYQLFKEWKNSGIGENDEIMSIGFIDNRYLYSCSIQGKLIIRDLINDDANQSYKVYFVANPISAIEIALVDHHFVFAISGYNNSLKWYSVNSRNELQCLTFANLLKSTSLSPLWTVDDSDFIILIKFVRNFIFCGTKFGKLLVYNKDTHAKVFSLKLSQFQLDLFVFGDYVVYCDSVSKIGIINSETFEIVSTFSKLKLGPVSDIQFFWNSIADPIYFVVTTLDKHLRIFKLENQTSELIVELPKMNSAIPSFCVLSNYQYHLFDKVFGNGSFKHPPKRRLSLPAPVKKKKIVIDHKDEERNEDAIIANDIIKNV